MIINGIDTDTVALASQEVLAPTYPERVQGRVAHIDADFLAYQMSYEKEPGEKSLEDMQHNTEVAVKALCAWAGATKVHLHLTPGLSNKGGRYDLAIQKEYQGTREGKVHPDKLHIMRDWMAKHWPGTLHLNCEADDGMSSAQYAAMAKGDRLLSVIISKDKDLNMVPGLHLDWDTNELWEADYWGKLTVDVQVSATTGTKTKKVRGYGRKWFWCQMLMGDVADNTQGLPAVWIDGKAKKVGQVMAYDLLNTCDSDWQAFDLVKRLYKEHGEKVGFVNYRDGTVVPWGKVLMSEAQLHWMRVNKDNQHDVLGYLGLIEKDKQVGAHLP